MQLIVNNLDFVVCSLEFLGLYNLIEFPEWQLLFDGIFCNVIPEFCMFFQSGLIAIQENLESKERYALKAAQSPVGNGYLSIAHYGQIIRTR